jgi:hypothetical protein
VNFDDVPDMTNVGTRQDAGGAPLPSHYPDFNLSWAKTAVGPGDIDDVFVRAFPGAPTPPNIISIASAGDPGIDSVHVGALVINFKKPVGFVSVWALPLPSLSPTEPSGTCWSVPVANPPLGYLAYPPNSTGWQPMSLVLHGGHIWSVVLYNGYFDELCYAGAI